MLGRILAHEDTTLSNITEAMSVYQQLRLPVTASAAVNSRDNGRLYDFIHPEYPIKPDATAPDLIELGSAIGNSFGWLAQGGCAEDWSKAEELLKASSQKI